MTTIISYDDDLSYLYDDAPHSQEAKLPATKSEGSAAVRAAAGPPAMARASSAPSALRHVGSAGGLSSRASSSAALNALPTLGEGGPVEEVAVVATAAGSDAGGAAVEGGATGVALAVDEGNFSFSFSFFQVWWRECVTADGLF